MPPKYADIVSARAPGEIFSDSSGTDLCLKAYGDILLGNEGRVNDEATLRITKDGIYFQNTTYAQHLAAESITTQTLHIGSENDVLLPPGVADAAFTGTDSNTTVVVGTNLSQTGIDPVSNSLSLPVGMQLTTQYNPTPDSTSEGMVVSSINSKQKVGSAYADATIIFNGSEQSVNSSLNPVIGKIDASYTFDISLKPFLCSTALSNEVTGFGIDVEQDINGIWSGAIQKRKESSNAFLMRLYELKDSLGFKYLSYHIIDSCGNIILVDTPLSESKGRVTTGIQTPSDGAICMGLHHLNFLILWVDGKLIKGKIMSSFGYLYPDKHFVLLDISGNTSLDETGSDTITYIRVHEVDANQRIAITFLTSGSNVWKYAKVDVNTDTTNARPLPIVFHRNLDLSNSNNSAGIHCAPIAPVSTEFTTADEDTVVYADFYPTHTTTSTDTYHIMEVSSGNGTMTLCLVGYKPVLKLRNPSTSLDICGNVNFSPGTWQTLICVFSRRYNTVQMYCDANFTTDIASDSFDVASIFGTTSSNPTDSFVIVGKSNLYNTSSDLSIRNIGQVIILVRPNLPMFQHEPVFSLMQYDKERIIDQWNARVALWWGSDWILRVDHTNGTMTFQYKLDPTSLVGIMSGFSTYSSAVATPEVSHALATTPNPIILSFATTTDIYSSPILYAVKNMNEIFYLIDDQLRTIQYVYKNANETLLEPPNLMRMRNGTNIATWLYEDINGNQSLKIFNHDTTVIIDCSCVTYNGNLVDSVAIGEGLGDSILYVLWESFPTLADIRTISYAKLFANGAYVPGQPRQLPTSLILNHLCPVFQAFAQTAGVLFYSDNDGEFNIYVTLLPYDNTAYVDATTTLKLNTQSFLPDALFPPVSIAIEGSTGIAFFKNDDITSNVLNYSVYNVDGLGEVLQDSLTLLVDIEDHDDTDGTMKWFDCKCDPLLRLICVAWMIEYPTLNTIKLYMQYVQYDDSDHSIKKIPGASAMLVVDANILCARLAVTVDGTFYLHYDVFDGISSKFYQALLKNPVSAIGQLQYTVSESYDNQHSLMNAYSPSFVRCDAEMKNVNFVCAFWFCSLELDLPPVYTPLISIDGNALEIGVAVGGLQASLYGTKFSNNLPCYVTPAKWHMLVVAVDRIGTKKTCQIWLDQTKVLDVSNFAIQIFNPWDDDYTKGTYLYEKFIHHNIYMTYDYPGFIADTTFLLSKWYNKGHTYCYNIDKAVSSYKGFDGFAWWSLNQRNGCRLLDVCGNNHLALQACNLKCEVSLISVEAIPLLITSSSYDKHRQTSFGFPDRGDTVIIAHQYNFDSSYNILAVEKYNMLDTPTPTGLGVNLQVSNIESHDALRVIRSHGFYQNGLYIMTFNTITNLIDLMICTFDTSSMSFNTQILPGVMKDQDFNDRGSTVYPSITKTTYSFDNLQIPSHTFITVFGTTIIDHLYRRVDTYPFIIDVSGMEPLNTCSFDHLLYVGTELHTINERSFAKITKPGTISMINVEGDTCLTLDGDSGNVGIRAPKPAYPLEVNGDAMFRDNLYISAPNPNGDGSSDQTELYYTFPDDTLHIVSNLKVHGNIEATGDFTITGDVYIKDDLILTDTLSIGGDVTVDADLFVSQSLSVLSRAYFMDTMDICGSTRIGSILSVTDQANIVGLLELGSTLSITDRVNIEGSVVMGSTLSIRDTLDVSGAVRMDSTLSVTDRANIVGLLELGSTLSVRDSVNIEGSVVMGSTLSVRDSVNIEGSVVMGSTLSIRDTLDVSGAVRMDSTLSVTDRANIVGLLELGSTLSVRDSVNIEGSVVMGSTLSIRDTLDVSGAVRMDSTLSVTDRVNIVGLLELGSTLSVRDSVNIEGSVVMGSTLSIHDTLDVSGAVRFDSTLSVTDRANIVGLVEMGSTLSVRDKVNIVQTLDVSGAVKLWSTLSVASSTYLTSTLSVANAVYFSSTLSVANTVVFSSTLSVANAVTLSSTLSVANAVIFSSTLSVANAVTFSSTLSVGNAVLLSSTLSVANAVYLNNTLSVRNSTSLVGFVEMGSTLSVNGATILRSTLDVSGAVRLWSALSVSNSAYLNSTLSVAGQTFINNTLSVANSVTLSSTLSVANAVTLSSTLSVSNVVTLSSTLSVGNAVTFSSTLSVANAVTLSSTLSVGNAVTFSSTLSAGNAVTFSSTLSVANVVTLSSTLSVGNAVTFSSTLSVANAVTLFSTLSVANVVTLSSTLSVGNAVTFSSTLSVANAVTLSSTLSVGNAVTMSSTLSVGNAVTMSSILSVANVVTFSSTLSVANSVTFSSTLSVANSVTLYSTLSVGNAVTFSRTLSVANAVTLSSTLSVGNAVTLSSTLSVGNAVTFSSTLSVVNAVTFSSTLSVANAVTLSSTLSVANAVTLSSTLSVGNAVYLSSTLSVRNSTSLVGFVEMGSTLSVSGATILRSTLDVSGVVRLWSTLSVSNSVYLNSTLSVAGQTYLNNTLSVANAVGFMSTLSVAGAVNMAITLDVSGDVRLWNTLSVSNSVYLNSTLSVVGAVNMSSTLDVSGVVRLRSTLSVSNSVYLNSTLSVAGQTFLNNTLSVANAVGFMSTLSVAGAVNMAITLDVSGAVRLWSTLSVSNSVYLNSTLSVAGQTFLNNTLSVSNAVGFMSTLSVANGVTFSSTLSVANSVTFSSTLSVANAVTLSSTLSIANAVYLNRTLSVANAVTFASTLSVTSAVTFSSTLSVANAVVLASTLSVAGQLYINNMNVVGAIIFSSTLSVGGSTFLMSTLSVRDVVYLSSSLSVASATYLSSTLSVGNAASFASTLSVNGATYLSGTLSVNGGTAINNVLSVASATFLMSTLSVGNAASFASTLSVNGATYLSGTLSVNGGTAINNVLSVASATFLMSTLSVGNAASFASTLSVNGAVYMNNNLSVRNAVVFSSSLSVGNQTFLSSTLSVVGAVGFMTTLSVAGQTFINNTLSVAGAVGFMTTLSVAGPTYINNTLSVNNSLGVIGGVYATGILSVGSQTYLRDTLTVIKDITLSTGSTTPAILRLQDSGQAYTLATNQGTGSQYNVSAGSHLFQQGGATFMKLDSKGLSLGSNGAFFSATSWTHIFVAACSDETTALSSDTGVAAISFRFPGTIQLRKIRFTLRTEDSNSESVTIRLSIGGTTLPDLTISTNTTMIESTTNLPKQVTDNDEILIYIWSYGGTTAAGLKFTMLYNMIS